MWEIPSDYLERCYAGWLGKVIGVRHGAPIEGWDYARIQRALGEIDGYLVDYREFAADDDTNGPMFFLRALEDERLAAPRDVTAEQIGHAWVNYAPYEHGMYWWGGYGKSTEHTAYLNLRAGIPAPRSGSMEQNGAMVAEQIGGQIFIDTWGLICPGNPGLAAEFAAKAASVSHGGNGIYGGVFVASAIAAAFTASNMRGVLETALGHIPDECEYARAARDVMAFYDADAAKDWRACMEHIIGHWGYDRYPGNCHIIPNAAVMIMAMLYGKGNFDRTINICNMAGWDTDCNVGNVGAIIGTLVGLAGIDFEKWRRPVNDFLAASSVVGSLNIMDLPDNVRTMARIAYRNAGVEPPADVRAFLNGPRFSFALPGSTHAFRLEHDGRKNPEMFLANEARPSGGRALKTVWKGAAAGNPLRLYHRTYYRPEHFHDNRYDPCFSPIVYPGQTIEAALQRPDWAPRVRACVYALDGNSGNIYRGPAEEITSGAWQVLRLAIPRLSGACIEQVGVELLPLEGGDAAVLLGSMDFSGGADYELDFSRERMEGYTGLHREVSQTTYLKGHWLLEDGLLSGSCADFGACYTGDVRWKDVEMTCAFTPVIDGVCGFSFRNQGAARGYSIVLEGEKVLLQKNELGAWRTLASVDMPLAIGKEYVFTARAKGNSIEIFSEGKPVLAATDDNNPYLSGMIGFRVDKGGHAHYRMASVKSSQ